MLLLVLFVPHVVGLFVLMREKKPSHRTNGILAWVWDSRKEQVSSSLDCFGLLIPADSECLGRLCYRREQEYERNRDHADDQLPITETGSKG
jgi:hypothetical protein